MSSTASSATTTTWRRSSSKDPPWPHVAPTPPSPTWPVQVKLRNAFLIGVWNLIWIGVVILFIDSVNFVVNFRFSALFFFFWVKFKSLIVHILLCSVVGDVQQSSSLVVSIPLCKCHHTLSGIRRIALITYWCDCLLSCAVLEAACLKTKWFFRGHYVFNYVRCRYVGITILPALWFALDKQVS